MNCCVFRLYFFKVESTIIPWATIGRQFQKNGTTTNNNNQFFFRSNKRTVSMAFHLSLPFHQNVKKQKKKMRNLILLFTAICPPPWRRWLVIAYNFHSLFFFLTFRFFWLHRLHLFLNSFESFARLFFSRCCCTLSFDHTIFPRGETTTTTTWRDTRSHRHTHTQNQLRGKKEREREILADRAHHWLSVDDVDLSGPLCKKKTTTTPIFDF